MTFYTKKIKKKTSWGGYLKINSTASAKTKNFSKIALTGSKVFRFRHWASICPRVSFPWFLVGNTVIEGDAYVSDLGIKAGIISGHYYNGKELVKGTISSGEGDLPELDPVWLNDIRRLLKYVPLNSDEVIQPEAINKKFLF